MKFDAHYYGKRFDKEDATKQVPGAHPHYPIYFDVAPLATKVKVKKLHPDAVIPQYQTHGAAGFDLVAVEDVFVEPGMTVAVPTGLAFEIPEGYELQIRPRSGITLRTDLRIANSPGTIDSDFRGEIKIIVQNTAPIEWGWDEKRGDVWPIVDYEGTTVDRDSYPLNYHEPLAGTYVIRKGDRIAQGIIAPVVRAQFEAVDELGETERGDGGFGSTGTR